MERVAIVGSRRHPNLEMVREYVRTLPRSTIVVTGGAVGVDITAELEAARCGLATQIYRPDDVLAMWPWLSYRDALIYRNTAIVCSSHRVVAFPDGTDGGTWDATRQAERFRRPCQIRWCDGRVVEGTRA